MKKAIFFLPLFLFLLNCTDKGELDVYNNTNASVKVSIDGSITYIQSLDNTIKTWELSNSIFNKEDKNVSISGEGLFKFKFSKQIKIKPKETSRVDIDADAGVISIINNTTSYIKAVYLSPSSDTNWGSDDLSGTIAPGEAAFWKISPGYWDVKFVDQDNYSYEAYNNYIVENQVFKITFSPSKTDFIISKNSKLKRKSDTHIYKLMGGRKVERIDNYWMEINHK